MLSTTASNEVLYQSRSVPTRQRGQYDINMWQELRKRWLIVGILVVVLFAVLAPSSGAPGGLLYTQYLRHGPLWWIYFSAGSRATVVRVSRRVVAVAVMSRAVAPALAGVVAAMDFADYRVSSGLVMLSLGGPCGWLSLGLVSRDSRVVSHAVAATVGNYVASLVVAPVTMGFVCGQFILPPLGATISSLLTTCTPFFLGVLYNTWWQKSRNTVADSCATLVLLYVECCELLNDAGGTLNVGDVLTASVVVLLWLVLCAVCCHIVALYCGDRDRTVLFCALPKAMDDGWLSSTACSVAGL